MKKVLLLGIISATLLSPPLQLSSFGEQEVVEVKTEVVEVERLSPPTPVQPLYRSMSVPRHLNTSFKAYMDGECITDTTSAQYRLLQQSYVDDRGLYMYEGRVLVAVGKYYSEYVGKKLRITLSSGIVFDAIVGDIKQSIHTDSTNRYTSNGNMVEFIVDTHRLDSLTRRMGDVSYSGFEGNVISIEEVME